MSVKLYEYLVKPYLFTLDPELAHGMATDLGRIVQYNRVLSYLTKKAYRFDDPRLKTELFGAVFDNPVGLAAGFDKNGRLVDFFHTLGFGFEEVGSVSAPWPGNDTPRLYRLLADEALINRMGLNNVGAEQVLVNLYDQKRMMPVGINVVKTNNPEIMGDDAIRDMVNTVKVMAPLAAYIVLNISCPNSPDGKTFEDPESLNTLVSEVRKEYTCHLLLKISPDVKRDHLEKIVSVAQRNEIDGYVATNTTLDRSGIATPDWRLAEIGKGGLSGAPLRQKATDLVGMIYDLTQGKVPIIGCGGINSAESAYEKIKAGASLVELYTGLVYKGPSIAKDINKGIVRLLERDGLKHISEAVGADRKRSILA